MTAILRESEEQFLFISHWVRKSSSSEMVAILWRHMVIKFDNHPRLIMVAISYFVFVWQLISFYFVLFQAKVIIKCLFLLTKKPHRNTSFLWKLTVSSEPRFWEIWKKGEFETSYRGYGCINHIFTNRLRTASIQYLN